MRLLITKLLLILVIVLVTVGAFVQQVIAGSAPTVTTEKDVYSYGEMITVKFSSAPGKDGDWICIIPAGTPDTEGGDYKYMPKGVGQGSLVFDAPTPGKYEARAYYNYARNGYVVAGRHTFTVESSPAHEWAMAARMSRKINPDNSIEANVQPGKGIVYVFREGLFVSAGFEVPVYADGKRVAMMQNSSYTPVILPEGDVKFSVDKLRENDRGETREIEGIAPREEIVKVKAGYAQYLKLRVVTFGLWALFLDQVPHEEGANIIKTYNLSLIK